MSATGSTEEADRTARHAWLLVAIVAMLAVSPIASGTHEPVPSLELVYTAVLVAALFNLGRGIRLRVAGIALAAPALLLNWVAWAMRWRELDIVADVLAGAFLSLVTAALFTSLLTTRRVTRDTILGGVCVYLLLAVVFTEAYSVVEKLAPGSLLERGQPLADSREIVRLRELTYFSFVTLSTLGYGDIVPSSPVARRLAAAEAVLGQIYIAVFIARLVGLHLAQQDRER